MRVLFAALALSILSFAAGIAGDLSIAAPPAPSVIVHLPPPIPLPPGVVRAHPLAPLTAAARTRAEPGVGRMETAVRRPRLALVAIVSRAKPETIQAVGEAKIDPDRAPKHDGPTVTQI